jgi:hypothetical protein
MTALSLTRDAATPPVMVVLRALGLGDLLTAVPALRALADAFPRHPRLLAVPTALAPLARCAGAVDEVVPAEGLDQPLSRLLHGAGLAVNLHGRGPESHHPLLAAEPRRLLAFAHPAVPASSQGPRWRADEHEVARWCRLLEESGIAADPRRLDIDLPPGPLPHGAREATLVHPGAASPARRWPAERFAAALAPGPVGGRQRRPPRPAPRPRAARDRGRPGAGGARRPAGGTRPRAGRVGVRAYVGYHPRLRPLQVICQPGRTSPLLRIVHFRPP